MKCNSCGKEEERPLMYDVQSCWILCTECQSDPNLISDRVTTMHNIPQEERERVFLEALDQVLTMEPNGASLGSFGKVNPRLLIEPKLEAWVVEMMWDLVADGRLELTPDRLLKRKI